MSHQGVKAFHQHCAVSLRLKAAPAGHQNFRDKNCFALRTESGNKDAGICRQEPFILKEIAHELSKIGENESQYFNYRLRGAAPFFEPPDRAIQTIHAALDQGVNYFDLDEAGNQFIPEKVYLDGGSKIGEVLRERRERLLPGCQEHASDL